LSGLPPKRDAPLPTEGPERKLASLDSAIELGIADIEAGRVPAAEDVFAEAKARYCANISPSKG
jgi:hypothetical protein